MNNGARIIIGFQGSRGSFSEMAVNEYMARTPLEKISRRSFKSAGYETFGDTIRAFYKNHHGQSNRPNLPDELLLPISNCNSRAVTDMQKELYNLGGWIAGEHFLHVQQCLLVNPGVKLEQVTEVWSMKPAIDQVTEIIRSKNLTVVYKKDTAMAAEEVKKSRRMNVAAIASPRAGEIYGLQNLGNVCDNQFNYTHFLHIVHPAKTQDFLPPEDRGTSFVTKIVLQGTLFPRSGISPFQIFTNNGVGVHEPIDADTGTFDHRTIILDLEGHMKSRPVRTSLAQLKNQSFDVRVKGCYHRHIFDGAHFA